MTTTPHRGRGSAATRPVLASGAQRALMRDMARDRQVTDAKAVSINELASRDDLLWDQAHELIDWLYTQPYKPRGGSSAAAVPSAVPVMPSDALLPNITRGGGYAVESSALAVAGITGVDPRGNDILFFRVKTAKTSGKRYMQRLTGAPGSFATEYMAGSNPTTVAVAELLATDPAGYMQAFGEHYSVCGKCGAELTDDASRRRKLGPDCAKQLGVI